MGVKDRGSKDCVQTGSKLVCQGSDNQSLAATRRSLQKDAGGWLDSQFSSDNLLLFRPA